MEGPDLEIIPTDPPFLSLDGRTYTIDEALRLVDKLSDKIIELIRLSSKQHS